MQERKAVHRCFVRVKRAVLCGAVLFALVSRAGPGVCQSERPGGRSGFIGSGVPFGRLGLLRELETPWHAGILSSFENPYLIEGLDLSTVLAGAGGRTLSMWLDWSHLGHPLFREDRVSALLVFALPVKGLRCAAIPGMQTRRVAGFDAQRAYSARLSASFEYRGAALISLERSVYEEDAAPRRRAGLKFIVRSGPLAFEIDRTSEAIEDETRVAVEARVHHSCSFLSSYRVGTGEVSGGFLIDIRPALLCFVWSQHPLLGSTLSAEAGRVWEW